MEEFGHSEVRLVHQEALYLRHTTGIVHPIGLKNRARTAF